MEKMTHIENRHTANIKKFRVLHIESKQEENVLPLHSCALLEMLHGFSPLNLNRVVVPCK